MSRKVFTDKEVEMLRDNQYTYAVTPHTLSFTKEFKELFWEEYQAGAIPRQILEKYGYPTDVLGKERIWGIAHIIKKQYYSPEGFHEGAISRPVKPPARMPRPRRSASAGCRARSSTSGRRLSF